MSLLGKVSDFLFTYPVSPEEQRLRRIEATVERNGQRLDELKSITKARLAVLEQRLADAEERLRNSARGEPYR